MKFGLRLSITLAAVTAMYPWNAEALTSLKAAGMGGVDTAYAQDSLTTVDNPANAAEICNHADLGFSWWGQSKELEISNRPQLPFTLQSGTFKAGNDNKFFVHAGVNYKINPCLAMGLAWNPEENIQTHYGTRLDDFSVFVDPAFVGSNTAFSYTVGALTGSVAYQFNRCHAFGISVSGYFSRLKVNGVAGLGSSSTAGGPSLSAFPDHVSDQGEASASGVGVTIGWIGQILPCVKAGVAYSPRVHMGSVRKYEGLLATHRLDIPEKFRVGLAWTASPCITVGIDAEYRNFGKARSWSNRFPGDSLNGIGAQFGTSDGPGFGWRDQWIVKLGGDWQFMPCWTARLGYRHESTPIRGGTSGALNVLTMQTVQDYITAGASWNFRDCADITVFGEYGFSHTVHGRLPDISFNPDDPDERVFQPGDLAYKARNYRAGLSIGMSF